jgi:hypothetical protein
MPNEVMIIVRAKNDTKAVFASIRKDARNLGDDMAIDVTETFTARLRREAAAASGAFGQIGDTIGETIGSRVSERIAERVTVDVEKRIREKTTRNDDRAGNGGSGGSNGGNGRSGGGGGGNDRSTDRDSEHVRVTVDVDKKSTLQRFADLVDGMESRLRDGLRSALSAAFSGDTIMMLLKAGGITALAGVIGPVLGAAISSAVLVALSGGGIAIGIIAALKDPRIQAAIGDLKAMAKTIFEDFGQFFKGPLENFLGGSGKGGSGGLAGVLKQITPMVHSLGEALGPIADKLGSGLIAMLQNLLPSILRAADAGAPLIKTLADELPGIGSAIASVFDNITKSGPEANEFWNDFLNMVQLVIRAIGWLIRVLAEMYHIVRTVVIGAITVFLNLFSIVANGAALAFGWIPGLGPKLNTAADRFARFKTKVNNELSKIDDVDVTVRIRQVFTTVGQQLVSLGGILASKAAGGITGAAAGGIRSGLTWAGEHGPELISVPAGSRVHSNPDSMRMAGAGTNSQPLLVQLVVDGTVLAQQMLDPQREIVRRRFGGSAQAAYGQ